MPHSTLYLAEAYSIHQQAPMVCLSPAASFNVPPCRAPPHALPCRNLQHHHHAPVVHFSPACSFSVPPCRALPHTPPYKSLQHPPACVYGALTCCILFQRLPLAVPRPMLHVAAASTIMRQWCTYLLPAPSRPSLPCPTPRCTLQKTYSIHHLAPVVQSSPAVSSFNCPPCCAVPHAPSCRSLQPPQL